MPRSKIRSTRAPASFTGAPARWWLNAALPALPVLACFLGGATEKWSEGIVVALFGAILLIHPPKVSSGPALNLIFLALLACAATAFLPADWFLQPAWRIALVEDFGVNLPGTLSPQPWITLGCFLSFLAALSWLYYVSTVDLDLRDVRTQLRAFAFGVACLTALCIALRSAHTAIPFWHNERGFGPFPNRNQTANLFGLTSVIIIACGQDDILRGRKRWILWLLALAVIVVGIVLDFSRAGVLLLVVGSGLWLGAFALRKASASRIALGGFPPSAPVHCPSPLWRTNFRALQPSRRRSWGGFRSSVGNFPRRPSSHRRFALGRYWVGKFRRSVRGLSRRFANRFPHHSSRKRLVLALGGSRLAGCRAHSCRDCPVHPARLSLARGYKPTLSCRRVHRRNPFRCPWDAGRLGSSGRDCIRGAVSSRSRRAPARRASAEFRATDPFSIDRSGSSRGWQCLAFCHALRKTAARRGRRRK